MQKQFGNARHELQDRLNCPDSAHVVQVTKTNTHVVVQPVRNAQGDGESYHTVRDSKWNQGAVTAVKFAQKPAADKGKRREYRVRQMRQAEQRGGGKAGQNTAVNDPFDRTLTSVVFPLF